MARPDPAQSAMALAASVRRLRRRYLERLARCQERCAEPDVHDLRIETRRLLALLELLRAFGLGDGLKKLRRIFKRRLDAFDPLRDTHVQLQLLGPLGRQFAEVCDVERQLQRRQKRFTTQLRRDVRQTRHRQLERRLKELEHQLRRSQIAPDTLPAAVDHAFAEVQARHREVRRARPATIHRLRIACKRFRYTCELLRPVRPVLDRSQLCTLRHLQGLMGDIQDHEVLLGTLAHVATEAPRHARKLAGLRRYLRERQRSLIDTFLAQADALNGFQPTSP